MSWRESNTHGWEYSNQKHINISGLTKSAVSTLDLALQIQFTVRVKLLEIVIVGLLEDCCFLNNYWFLICVLLSWFPICIGIRGRL